MALPAGTALLTLTGTRIKPDNTPQSGVLVFKLLSSVPPGIASEVPSIVRARLDTNGYFSQDLLVPTDHVAYPSGWLYEISFWYDNGGYVRSNYYLDDSLSTVDIDTLTPVAVENASKYATKAELAELESRMTYTTVIYTPSTEWLITHNLGYKPAVSVIDSTNETVVPDVEYVDDNTVRLTFGFATSGRANFS